MAASLLALVACVGGGGGSSPGPTAPPPAAEQVGASPGLTGAVAGDGILQVSFRLSDEGHEAALFQGSDPATLFQGAPVLTNLTGERALLPGQVNGQTTYLGLGLRAAGGGAFTATGPVLRARPGPVIYVDPGANPVGADGTTPATAYASPLLALIDSFGAGGANIHLLGGAYPPASLPVFGGSHLYGGFAPGFDLAERDPATSPTVLHALAGQTLAAVQGVDAVVLDGLTLAGGGLASHGVDMDSTPLELRGVTVDGCAQRGVRVRAAEGGSPVPVLLVDCSVSGNGSGGFSGLGSLAVAAHGSSFFGNQQEGFDLDDLVAADGGSASLRVDGCTFADNASDGLDVDLAAPLLGGSLGGEFDVCVTRSRFLGNGAVGLLVDVDYELQPLWKASIEVDGCRSYDNGDQGLLLDVDQQANVAVLRSTFEANGAAGLEVTSSAADGLVLVAGCASLGNLGAGFARTVGQVALLTSHCLAAGNGAGGLRAVGGVGQATSSLTLLEDPPALGFDLASTVDLGADAAALERAPEAFLVGGALVGGQVAVPDAGAFAADAEVEVAADGVARTAAAASATVLALSPAPPDRGGPTPLMAFAPGADVSLDPRPVLGSAAEGAGLSGLDGGPAGLPATSTPLELEELPTATLRLKSVEPALAQPLAGDASLLLRFQGGTPDAAGVAAGLEVLDGAGDPTPFTASPDGDGWRIEPAGPTWDTGGTGLLRLRLLEALTGPGGVPNAAPLELHLTVL